MKTASAKLPTKFGEFTVHIYKTSDQKEHAVLIKEAKNNCVVRVHSECLTGEVFHSLRCDCQAQLIKALKIIGEEGGILVYLRQEGRGIGLFNKIKAYALQDKGLDTVEANNALGFNDDEREFAVAAEILHDLKISSIRLLTNNPKKQEVLNEKGILVTRIPLTTRPTEENRRYLLTKKEKMGHLFEEQ